MKARVVIVAASTDRFHAHSAQFEIERLSERDRQFVRRDRPVSDASRSAFTCTGSCRS